MGREFESLSRHQFSQPTSLLSLREFGQLIISKSLNSLTRTVEIVIFSGLADSVTLVTQLVLGSLFMTHLSIRLPDDITRSLDEEARLTGQNRSTVVREAVEVYLVGQAQARLSADIVAAAQVLADHAHQSQERSVASEGQEDWLASIEAEEGDVSKWWS